jgi:hypothetical protein
MLKNNNFGNKMLLGKAANVMSTHKREASMQIDYPSSKNKQIRGVLFMQRMQLQCDMNE